MLGQLPLLIPQGLDSEVCLRVRFCSKTRNLAGGEDGGPGLRVILGNLRQTKCKSQGS